MHPGQRREVFDLVVLNGERLQRKPGDRAQIRGAGRSIGPPSGSVKLMGEEALSVAVSSRKIGQTLLAIWLLMSRLFVIRSFGAFLSNFQRREGLFANSC